HDSHGVQLLAPEDWDVRMLVVILTDRAKPIGSREAMNRTVGTSPYYPAWRENVAADLETAKGAIAARDLPALGELAESNALRMHASMLAARPPVLYWLPETIATMEAIRRLRDGGHMCWFTLDAGPNVKVLCDPASETAIRTALADIPGVQRIVSSRPGPGVELLAQGDPVER
ncbi:MAG: diphosphomevalonate decarboxylase, partial [Cyanobacteria bacterium REEB65]|nr:diphosphomevalonate decarboxylase [Cyanobacteria bacterium REEB65]